MTVQLDPEKQEIRALFEIAGDLKGKRVLEIGCGDGRLTWRYAYHAANVVGIDPNADKIARAISMTPEDLRERIELRAVDLESLALTWSIEHPEPLFDLALLSWAL